MSKKEYGFMVVLAIIAAIVSGVISSWLLMGQAVFAEKKGDVPRVIRAQSFQVIDEAGSIRIELGGKLGTLAFFDKDGEARAYNASVNINEIFGK
jgi:hypothetical protein